ncbi:unnamed protein product [Phytophthora fragariaefolia]|uniref:Unnamed protein product n=1 Tax=Phytophthora fragariaefolia TaxID=1490495 RepID=A0A9W6TZV7_9STRA|nr:unnamed protein product [Phytophthora fragariaefolia]
MGKGKALPPAAVGAICNIDVVGAAPVAQRVRRVAPQFREKLSDLIKSLLSAKMITSSTSPWASPIVIIIKKNGVDIRLCIDYRLVNSLTRLMVYPMPMINDPQEDLDKVIWTGMPFGLKNAPQIYQRLIDNALYGHLRISPDQDRSKPVDVFEAREPESNPKPSVLGRRSCIDDFLVTATTWDSMCEKVERLLDACERWNLSISMVKSFWGQRKVYLGHQMSADGLEAHPKDLETLAVLYELREGDFHESGRQEANDPSGRGTGGVVASAEQTDRWTRAKVAFTMLKAKLVSTPILKHFDPDRTPVIILYASQWAIPAALVQEYDGVYWTVTFTSRTLKSNELNYGIVDKEVLNLLRMLKVNYTLLITGVNETLHVGLVN